MFDVQNHINEILENHTWYSLKLQFNFEIEPVEDIISPVILTLKSDKIYTEENFNCILKNDIDNTSVLNKLYLSDILDSENNTTNIIVKYKLS